MSSPIRHTLRNDTATSLLSEIQSRHPYPLSIQIIVTYQCNLHCAHCFLIKDRSPQQHLTLEDYERLFDDWADLGVIQLCISGGEAALRPDLADIVAAASKRRYATRLKTSANQFTTDDATLLYEMGLAVVEVSVYHADAEKHDRFVRKNGAFDTAFRFARQFQKHGGIVQLNIMAMNWNIDAIPKLLDLAETEGFLYSVDLYIRTKEDGTLSPTALRPDLDAMEQLMRDPRIVDLKTLTALPGKDRNAKICGAGVSILQVEPNGDVRLCDKFPWVLGNVRRQSLKDIVDQSAVLKRLRETRWKDLSVCGNCTASGICAHCPGAALLETGDHLNPLPFECDITARKMKLLGRPFRKPYDRR